MEITIHVMLAFMVATLSRAHVLYTYNNQLPSYPYISPFALSHSYIAPQPYPYSYNFAPVAILKSHLPEHESDSQPDDKETSSTTEPIEEKPMEDDSVKQEKEADSGAEEQGNDDDEKSANLKDEMPPTEMPPSPPPQAETATGDLKYYTFSDPTPLGWPPLPHYLRSGGSYPYVDNNYKLKNVNYISDASGFRVITTNIPKQTEPVAIPDSGEVKRGRSEKFKAKTGALQRMKGIN